MFRVPQDHDGRGVVCPACRVMLRLPGPDDELTPLVIPPRAAEPEVVEEIDFEADEEVANEGTGGDYKFIIGLAVPGLLLLGLFAWWMMPDPVEPRSSPRIAVPSAGSVPGGGTREPAAKPLMLQLEAVAKAFLEAPDVAEVLRHVRDPEKTAPKLEAWLAGKPYVAPGFHELISKSVATSSFAGKLIMLKVRTGDFEMRDLVLVGDKGSFKVDWESWVGWSEMSWEEFQSERPAQGKWFRVSLSRVDYYNFAFKNELEWSSYRLDSPDGSTSLYGYIPRTSQLDQEIRPVDEEERVKLLLKLRYPTEPPTGNQVLIEGVSGDGWVELVPPEAP